MNLIQHTTQLAMHIVSAYIRPGDTVIDATCGNGYDSLQLASYLGLNQIQAGAATLERPQVLTGEFPAVPAGRLFAFDLQDTAIANTRKRLAENGFAQALENGQITLVCQGHEKMPQYFQEQCPFLPQALYSMDRCDCGGAGFAAAVIFNLGYLPGGDKAVTTRSETTLAAVKGALDLLKPDGILCVTMYCGHPEGKREKTQLLEFARGMDSRAWHVSYIQMYNQWKDPPEILLISRKGRNPFLQNQYE